jgi:hypothetical protein
MLRIKQTNGLDFSTAMPTSPTPPSQSPTSRLVLFFMKFRGPQALSNRPQKAMVCPTMAGLKPRAG